MNADEFFLILFSIAVPASIFVYILHKAFAYKEKKLQVQAQRHAARDGADTEYTRQLEARVRVLEEIVTDRGADTAAQIEALRKTRQLEGEAR